MVIYYAVYALLIFGWLFQKRCNSKTGTRNYFIFAFILVAGMLALRHPSMGVDLAYGKPNGYLASFSKINNMSWNRLFQIQVLNYEKGYLFFCKLIGYISDDPQTLLVFCAVIPIFLIFYCLYKYSDNLLFSLIIYLGLPCFLINYSGLRQAVAIGITTFSLKFIEEKKPKRFVAAVIAASLFHSSAVVFLLAYPLYRIKFSSVFKYISAAAIPLVFVFRYQLFAAASKIFKENAEPDDNNAIMLFLAFMFIYLFMLLFSDDSDSVESGCRNLFWVACICQAFGGVYSTAIRVGYYYMIFLAILLPKAAARLSFGEDYRRPERDALLTGMIYLCFIAFGLYSLYNGSWAMSNPYHFFWQKI